MPLAIDIGPFNLRNGFAAQCALRYCLAKRAPFKNIGARRMQLRSTAQVWFAARYVFDGRAIPELKLRVNSKVCSHSFRGSTNEFANSHSQFACVS